MFLIILYHRMKRRCCESRRSVIDNAVWVLAFPSSKGMHSLRSILLTCTCVALFIIAQVGGMAFVFTAFAPTPPVEGSSRGGTPRAGSTFPSIPRSARSQGTTGSLNERLSAAKQSFDRLLISTATASYDVAESKFVLKKRAREEKARELSRRDQTVDEHENHTPSVSSLSAELPSFLKEEGFAPSQLKEMSQHRKLLAGGIGYGFGIPKMANSSQRRTSRRSSRRGSVSSRRQSRRGSQIAPVPQGWAGDGDAGSASPIGDQLAPGPPTLSTTTQYKDTTGNADPLFDLPTVSIDINPGSRSESRASADDWRYQQQLAPGSPKNRQLLDEAIHAAEDVEAEEEDEEEMEYSDGSLSSEEEKKRLEAITTIGSKDQHFWKSSFLNRRNLVFVERGPHDYNPAPPSSKSLRSKKSSRRLRHVHSSSFSSAASLRGARFKTAETVPVPREDRMGEFDVFTTSLTDAITRSFANLRQEVGEGQIGKLPHYTILHPMDAAALCDWEELPVSVREKFVVGRAREQAEMDSIRRSRLIAYENHLFDIRNSVIKATASAHHLLTRSESSNVEDATDGASVTQGSVSTVADRGDYETA